MSRGKVMPQRAGDVARMKIGLRKMAHEYDMSRPSILKFSGTMLPLLVSRWELWVFVLVHIALVVIYRLGKNDEFEAFTGFTMEPDYEAPWNICKIPTALLVFFLVFFNGKCYDRFVGYYNAHCAIGGRLQHITAQTLSAWPHHPAARWDALRYLIASAVVVYMKVSDPPGKPQPIEPDEWERLTQAEGKWLNENADICPPLLTPEEVAVLKEYKGNLQMLLQTWGLRELRHGCKVALPKGEAEVVYVEMEREVFELRTACAFIVNNLAMPIPFPYFHALNLLLVINYSLYTYAFLYYDSVLTPLMLFLVIVVTLGMREVSTALSNPFGEDEVDFPIHKYIMSIRGLISSLVREPILPPDAKATPRAHGGGASPPPPPPHAPVPHAHNPYAPQPHAPPPHSPAYAPLYAAPAPPSAAGYAPSWEAPPPAPQEAVQLSYEALLQQYAALYAQLAQLSAPPLAAQSRQLAPRQLLPPIQPEAGKRLDGGAACGAPPAPPAHGHVYRADGVPVRIDVPDVEYALPFGGRT